MPSPPGAHGGSGDGPKRFGRPPFPDPSAAAVAQSTSGAPFPQAPLRDSTIFEYPWVQLPATPTAGAKPHKLVGLHQVAESVAPLLPNLRSLVVVKFHGNACESELEGFPNKHVRPPKNKRLIDHPCNHHL